MDWEIKGRAEAARAASGQDSKIHFVRTAANGRRHSRMAEAASRWPRG